MAIEFTQLPYAINALEPALSQQTLEFHYGKHHKSYVDHLNELIKGTHFDSLGLEEIMRATINEVPKIYNDAAQVWNHTFYWNSMTPKGKPMSDTLQKKIEAKFGSVKSFQQLFFEKGKSHFGSGWVWLVKDKNGFLAVVSTGNAENPLQNGQIPLLTCDVWEHAYYLDYQNLRPKYLENFWSIANWEFAEKNYLQS